MARRAVEVAAEAEAPLRLPQQPESSRSDRFAEAQQALVAFWSSPGTRLGAGFAAEACRNLDIPQLHLLRVWVPRSSPGSSTAEKC